MSVSTTHGNVFRLQSSWWAERLAMIPDEIAVYLKPSGRILEAEVDYGDARYVVFGIPYDLTSSFRYGSRFAPRAVREASTYIEVYSTRASFDASNLKIADLGDLACVYGLPTMLRRVKAVVGRIARDKKIPVMIGGEHTFTYSAVEALGRDTALVSFDAHMDLRPEYLGDAWSHATVMRRIAERIDPQKIVIVGPRAFTPEERRFAQHKGMSLIYSWEITSDLEESKRRLLDALSSAERIYLTLDMDVLDIPFAPGVGNPEPEGINSSQLYDLLSVVSDRRLVGFDIAEVCPPYDHGQAAVHAAKALVEVLAHLEISTDHSIGDHAE